MGSTFLNVMDFSSGLASNLYVCRYAQRKSSRDSYFFSERTFETRHVILQECSDYYLVFFDAKYPMLAYGKPVNLRNSIHSWYLRISSFPQPFFCVSILTVNCLTTLM